jgi:hypothetical protein
MEDMEDVDNWEDLPGQITALIRDQPGLRFDGEPIRSREDLELAYRLPRNFVQESTDNPEMLELSKLAILVLLAYRKMICRDRREQVIDVIILRAIPYDVLSRKCGSCDQIFLDHPFPYWSKNSPNFYVSWQVHGGCGHVDCEGSYPRLKPLRRGIKWSEAVVKRLKRIANDHQKPPKQIDWLLRHDQERGDLPQEVKFKCHHCPQTKIVLAKLTIHPLARLVVPEIQCWGPKDRTGQGCGKKGPWDPVEKFQKTKTIRQANLSRTFIEFRQRGCDLRHYPREGSVVFSEKDNDFRIAELKELKTA